MLLIISEGGEAAELLAETVFRMGILCYGATPKEGEGEEVKNYTAILFLGDGESFTPLVARARESVPPIPCFAANGGAGAKGFAKIFPRGTYAPRLIDDMDAALANEGRRGLGEYALGALDASARLATPRLGGKPLPFTKTESMILRALIRGAPTGMSAETILKYAFRRSRLPAAASIRTHISVINKKFKAITGGALIVQGESGGYAICEEMRGESDKRTSHEAYN